MRDNPLKPRLAAGGHAFGTMVFEFFTPGLAQICKEAGAEFLLYDMEHSAVSIETIREQFAYCRGVGIVPMVRVPATQYDYISRALDAGAMGPTTMAVWTPLMVGLALRRGGRKGTLLGMHRKRFS